MSEPKERTPLRLKIILAVLGTVQTVLTAAVGFYLDYRTEVKDDQSKQLIAYQQAQLDLVNQRLWEKTVRNETDIEWLIKFVGPGFERPAEVEVARGLDLEDEDFDEIEEALPPPVVTKAKPRPRVKKRPALPTPKMDYVRKKRMEQRQLFK